jgi:signal transduction histidine kinase
VKGIKIGTKITLFNLLILVLFYIISFISLWTLLSISSNYRLKNYREELISERKYCLKNIVTIGYNLIQEAYNSQKSQSRHKTNDEEAKNKALLEIKKMRYDEGVGYLWINDTSKPYPVMVMHPIMPELNYKILSDSKYNTVGNEKRNLFAVAVEICEKNGSGFIEYLWRSSLL